MASRKTILIISVFIFCGAAGLAAMSYFARKPGKPVPQPSYPISRHFRYSYTLKNNTNRVVKDVEFRTYAPVRQTATQRCVSVKSSHPYQMVADELGNQILSFRFDAFTPYATKIITIHTDLLFADHSNRTVEENRAIFLKPEKYIESDATDLSRLAGRLKSAEALQTVENIYHWIVKNIRYSGYSHDIRGARYAILRKEGDCTEFMCLFTALCRADNIPARGVGGYVYGESAILRPSDYHNWAEFYLDGAWRIADPQKKNIMENQSSYVAMRIISASAAGSMDQFNRFFYKGNGLQIKMN